MGQKVPIPDERMQQTIDLLRSKFFFFFFFLQIVFALESSCFAPFCRLPVVLVSVTDFVLVAQ